MVGLFYFGTKQNKTFLCPIFIGFYSNINNAEKAKENFIQKNKHRFDEEPQEKDFFFTEQSVNENAFYCLGMFPLERSAKTS